MVQYADVYFPRCVGYANSAMSIGAGCTTNIPAAPTINRETMNWASDVDVAWMMVARITPMTPDSNTGFLPKRSDSQPTSGKASTDPSD